jgi:hypothetical protein
MTSEALHRSGLHQGTLAILALLLSCHGSGAMAQASTVGQWSQPYSWPDVAIHLHLLPTGKILSFSDDDDANYVANGTRKANFSKTYIVDMPDMQPPGAVIYLPDKTTDLFCSASSFLPDGRLLVLGGHEGKDGYGSTDVNFLSYGKDARKYRWTLDGTRPMKGGRWYASATTLPDGEVVVVGGEITPGTINPMPEVWQTNSGGGWRELSAALLSVPLYSPLHVAPNGKVFMPGSAQLTRYLDTTEKGLWTNVGNRLYGSRDYGPSVMYEPGKVLIVGGGNPPTATAEVINLNATSPVWAWTNSMHFARRHANATILPDGKVLVTGGTSSGGFNDATNAVFAAEMWNPADGSWTVMASAQVKRVYHSSAVLLPDGRVMSAGGGRPHPIAGSDNYNVEFFSPPYLFKGARPRITSAPNHVRYGEVFSVKTPDAASITSVTLVKLSTVTHTFNMGQRLNRLTFIKTRDAINVTPPSDRRIAPPGHYMLFLLNSAGVPSIAEIIQIT